LAQSLAGKGQGQWLQHREVQLAELARRGLELVQAGEFEQAESCYRQGLSLDPNSARLCFNLAKLQYRQGKLESCQRYLQAANRLGADDEELMREIKNFTI
jgi:Flp pilus assembly protein TadD